MPLPLDVVKTAAGTAPREAAPSTENGGGAKGGVCRSRPAQMSLRGAARLSLCTTRLHAALSLLAGHHVRQCLVSQSQQLREPFQGPRQRMP